MRAAYDFTDGLFRERLGRRSCVRDDVRDP
jgi:hypothetical protein